MKTARTIHKSNLAHNVKIERYEKKKKDSESDQETHQDLDAMILLILLGSGKKKEKKETRTRRQGGSPCVISLRSIMHPGGCLHCFLSVVFSFSLLQCPPENPPIKVQALVEGLGINKKRRRGGGGEYPWGYARKTAEVNGPGRVRSKTRE